MCDLKVPWDKEVPIDIQTQWLKWITGLKTEIKIRRPISIKNERITEIDIQLFSDASTDWVCTVAYAVVYQPSKVNQSLITSKSRLAKKNISIPRLKLIAAHLPSNLKCCLSKFNIRELYAWSDSTVTLHWLKDNGEHKVLVCNRVAKIKEKGFINWKYVPTKQNPADLGSWVCDIDKLEQNWWEGLVWQRDQISWHDQSMIESSEESEIDRKRVKEILAVTVSSEIIYDKLLVKYPTQFWKA